MALKQCEGCRGMTGPPKQGYNCAKLPKISLEQCLKKANTERLPPPMRKCRLYPLNTGTSFLKKKWYIHDLTDLIKKVEHVFN